MPFDDTDKKLFVQFDDPMPGQRANAFEMLRDRLAKKTPPETFVDVLAEFENEVERHNETTNLLNWYWRENRALAAMLWVKGKWRRHWRGALFVSAAAALIVTGINSFTGESAADRAAINNSFASTLASVSFGVGDSKAAVYYPQGKAYWGVIRGEVVTGRNVDAHGLPVTLNCLHLYATPASESWHSFLKADPYTWPVGWVSWPERATLCKPTTQTAADARHALDSLIGTQR
jgi:hypothetical protein